MPLDHPERFDDVAAALRHLFPFGIGDDAVDHHVAVWRRRPAPVARELVAEPARDRKKRVEPSARLVLTLGDEIARELARDLVPILEGVVPLREGHRARVVPGVDDLGCAVHTTAAARDRAAPREAVDARLVRIEVRRQRGARALGEIRVAPDGVHMIGVAVAHP